MDQSTLRFLDDLHRRGQEHDEQESDRLTRYRNLEPDTARLLGALVRAQSPRRLLELGTSNGYSTIWLADAARAVGGRLVSVDVDRGRSDEARRNLSAAGLEDHVDLRVEDAATTLVDSDDGSWDFIFLDAERRAYTDYWPELVRVLASGALLVVDNVISHAIELVEFRKLVDSDEGIFQALCPIGAGALLVVRERQSHRSDSGVGDSR